jgi:hypothetical protein
MPHPADIAFTDQADAAEAHLSRILDHTAAGLLGDDHRTEDIAPWLAHRLGEFAAELANREMQLCEHLANATAPHPAFGILGADRLACPACARALTPAGDVLCARCGQPTELMEPALVNLGTIALLVLTCDPCATTA